MSSYNPRIVLITGGAGFIGSHFIRYLLQHNQDIKIINLDKLTYAGSLDNLHDIKDRDRYHFVKGDICDAELTASLLDQHDIDTVVHFAAESHVDRSISGPEEFIRTNIIGTYTLLEAARRIWLERKKMGRYECRFHHISTDEVYGALTNHDPAFSETTPYSPRSPYSASKAGSDHIVNAYYHTYQLPITISNCSNNYGAYQYLEKFIPTVINSCLQWKPVPIYGDGSNIRDWLYVGDHCSAIDLIITKGRLGESYNIGGNNEISNLNLAKMICDIMNDLVPQKQNYNTLIHFVNDRLGHDWRYGINANKITKELGWLPSACFKNNLFETVKWYVNKTIL